MDMNEIMKLIQAVSDYGLTSFELEEGNMKISLKRKKEVIAVQAPGVGAATVSAAEPEMKEVNLGSSIITSSAPAPAEAVSASQETPAASADIASDKVVTSPLVGVFYSASSPEAEPFVKVGDRIKKGQVLGIIEAMKLMKEIESEYDGVVEAILVNNEDTVEFGQPLFRIG